MTLWLDAHISPAIANWIRKEFGLEVWPLRDLGLSRASDELIFRAAQGKDIVFITKDSDFVTLQSLKGPPPKIILLALGNTSNTPWNYGGGRPSFLRQRANLSLPRCCCPLRQRGSRPIAKPRLGN
ncbi:DUF5615 family PIN-like protein [Calidithermus roseus]|uniref:DUF5615 domain-containing protein n=1 Tax=Calidithermus roseus TaxID=1644118 RepID=A0A399F224_9DEIN|nr:DUF5615 family PIN-like protein [Calidithermus roseus]RIH89309.1 hypothetical protein Mrose_00449 [Calidithermus roseus]